jgi:hypothetical protein
MQTEPRRTFIPPENRPVIRGAELRSEQDSRHYLAIFNHPMRRKLFIREIHKNLAFDLEAVFGVQRSQWNQIIRDLSFDLGDDL